MFWAQDGKTIKNLKELEHALHYMNPDTFRHHVTASKNDFANWIDHVMHEETLAKLVKMAKTKDNIRRLVKKRVEEIEHPPAKKVQVKKADMKMKKKTVKVKTAKKRSVRLVKKTGVKKTAKRTVKKVTRKKTAKKPTAVLDEAFRSITEPANHHISLVSHMALGIVVGSALTLLVLMIL
jgi:hypothetical protein